MSEKKENRRTKMTKALLRESLIELLETQSIRQISIKAICENADVNRSTFYLYYGSQYDLLNDINNGIIEDTRVILEAEYARHGEKTVTIDDLTRLLTVHLEYVRDNIKFFMAFGEDYETPLKTMHIILDPYISQIAAEKGLDDIQEHRLFTFAAFGCIGTVKDWIAHYAAMTGPEALALTLSQYIESVTAAL